LVLDFFIYQFRKNSMSLKTKMINKTAAVFCVLMSAATYVHSAITITFAQSGPNVTMTSLGTFDPAVCGTTTSANFPGNYVSVSYKEIRKSDGGSFKNCRDVSVSSPNSGSPFGQGGTFQADAHSGANFLFSPTWDSNPFAGPANFSNTTSFQGSLTFNSKTLSGMGLNTGSYVYTYTKPNTSIQDTITVVVPVMNSAPAATSVSIAGTVQAGSTLTGSYTYTDADSDAQGTSTFRWVKNNANTGVGGGTNVGTTTTYSPVAGDVGSYLYYCVTPVAAAGTTTGTEVCSAATSAVAVAPAPTAIPTLSEWAMIFLASLMGLFAFARIRRQS
jgi:hypothetical protein